MGPLGVLVENQTPKDSEDPHHQIPAIPHPEDRSPLGRRRAGCEVGGECRTWPRHAAARGRPPAPCGQRRTALTASRMRARRSRAPWRPLTRLRRRTTRMAGAQRMKMGGAALTCITHATANGTTDQVAAAGGAGQDRIRRSARTALSGDRASGRRRAGHCCADFDGVLLLASGRERVLKTYKQRL